MTTPQAFGSFYAGSSALLLSLILFVIGGAAIFLGARLVLEIKLPKPGRVLRIVIIVAWLLSLLVSVRILLFTTSGPIFPITLASAVGSLACIAFVSRRQGIFTALRNGFVAALGGAALFELPYLLIITPGMLTARAHFMPRHSFYTSNYFPNHSLPFFNFGFGGIFGRILFLPLFATVITSLFLLSFPRGIAITRYSLYAFGAMFAVFAVWALFGFSFPSDAVSFTLNAISKVLAFVTIVAMFITTGSNRKDAQKEVSDTATRQETVTTTHVHDDMRYLWMGKKFLQNLNHYGIKRKAEVSRSIFASEE